MAQSRTEHLEWCKQRALEFLDKGDLDQALASFASDMSKHPETGDHPMLDRGMTLLMTRQLDTDQQIREFITGFN